LVVRFVSRCMARSIITITLDPRCLFLPVRYLAQIE
jgi:hypothetical protein